MSIFKSDNYPDQPPIASWWTKYTESIFMSCMGYATRPEPTPLYLNITGSKAEVEKAKSPTERALDSIFAAELERLTSGCNISEHGLRVYKDVEKKPVEYFGRDKVVGSDFAQKVYELVHNADVQFSVTQKPAGKVVISDMHRVNHPSYEQDLLRIFPESSRVINRGAYPMCKAPPKACMAGENAIVQKMTHVVETQGGPESSDASPRVVG